APQGEERRDGEQQEERFGVGHREEKGHWENGEVDERAPRRREAKLALDEHPEQHEGEELADGGDEDPSEIGGAAGEHGDEALQRGIEREEGRLADGGVAVMRDGGEGRAVPMRPGLEPLLEVARAEGEPGEGEQGDVLDEPEESGGTPGGGIGKHATARRG